MVECVAARLGQPERLPSWDTVVSAVFAFTTACEDGTRAEEEDEDGEEADERGSDWGEGLLRVEV